MPFSETVVLSEQLPDRGEIVFSDEVHGFLLHWNWANALDVTYDFINRFIGKNAE